MMELTTVHRITRTVVDPDIYIYWVEQQRIGTDDHKEDWMILRAFLGIDEAKDWLKNKLLTAAYSDKDKVVVFPPIDFDDKLNFIKEL